MINLDIKSYDFYLYGSNDGYGQASVSEAPQGKVKIAVYPSSQSIQDNINYKDAQYVGFTHNKAVSDSYVIGYKGKRLKVLYVMPKGRLITVFLKEL